MKSRRNSLFQLLVVLGMLISINGWAQIVNLHLDYAGKPLLLDKLEGSSGVQGSPYFTSEWRTGILMYENKRIENVQLRYNAFEDHVVIMNNNQPFIPDEKLVGGFEFTQVEDGTLASYTFKNGFEGDGIIKKNYLSIIYEGKELVLAQRFKIDQIEVTPVTYGEKSYKEFTLTKNYVLVNKGAAQKFKPSKKSFTSQFPGLADKLKIYFKDNDVKFNDSGDLAKLMAFIDEK